MKRIYAVFVALILFLATQAFRYSDDWRGYIWFIMIFGFLVSTFGISGLRGIERAVAWRLDERNESASLERLEWACRALLANAVSQAYRIRQRPAYRELAAAAR